MNYSEFVLRKKQLNGMFGFKDDNLPDFLFDFQKSLVDWALQKGRAAIFADTGLGKTAMQLAWADRIVKKTNKKVLLLTPLAVSSQTVKEAEKFGIDAKRSRDGKPAGDITVTNYQQLEKFNHNDFTGLVCDESSILKGFNGKLKTDITRFMVKLPYRLLCTATPSPNDYVELGTSSEALGDMKFLDMCSTFFRDTSNDKNPQWSTPKWELKDHAIHDFWRWVVSWARAIRMPSDLGFDDGNFKLPSLHEKEHCLKVSTPLDGFLFVARAETLSEQREERKKTVEERCEKVRELVENHESSVIWAHYNYETDYLEKIIPDSVQVSGSDCDDSKEEKFNSFLSGDVKRIIIKPKIGAFGLNWQHCNHMTFFPSHSYEQYYQGVRRCYRFGQKREVFVDIITTEGEEGVSRNIKRKAEDAKKMFQVLVDSMNNELKHTQKEDQKKEIILPSFL